MNVPGSGVKWVADIQPVQFQFCKDGKFPEIDLMQLIELS